MVTEANKKVISRLKEARIQKGLTYQDIVDACEAKNEPVSLSTVKRMFSKASDDGPDYRTSTINTIFRAVIGTEDLELTAAEEADLTDTGKELITENAALKAVIEMRDATILELQQQIDSLSQENNALKAQMDSIQLRLTTTIDLFKVGMESLGRGVGQ